MQRFFGVIALLMSSHWLTAQQLPLFTQYREYNTLINPAAPSAAFFSWGATSSFGLTVRNQYVGVDGGPRTQALRGHVLQEFGGNTALHYGGYLLNDKTGPTSFTGGYGQTAVILSDDPESYGISLGLNAGLVQYRVDASKLRLRDKGDVEATDQRKIFPDAGVGVFAWMTLKDVNGVFQKSQVYGGFSIPQVLGLDLNFSDENGQYQTRRIQHYFIQGGWRKQFRDDSQIDFNAWGKYTKGARFNMDFNLRYTLMSALWLGGGASTAGVGHAEIGYVFGAAAYNNRMFSVGYSFDYGFNTSGPLLGAAHEIQLAYIIGQ
jgi:type IX secretion system PorP/SprF family membrane protein